MWTVCTLLQMHACLYAADNCRSQPRLAVIGSYIITTGVVSSIYKQAGPRTPRRSCMMPDPVVHSAQAICGARRRSPDPPSPVMYRLGGELLQLWLSGRLAAPQRLTVGLRTMRMRCLWRIAAREKEARAPIRSSAMRRMSQAVPPARSVTVDGVVTVAGGCLIKDRKGCISAGARYGLRSAAGWTRELCDGCGVESGVRVVCAGVADLWSLELGPPGQGLWERLSGLRVSMHTCVHRGRAGPQPPVYPAHSPPEEK